MQLMSLDDTEKACSYCQRESGRRWSSGKKMGLILPSGSVKLLGVTIDNAIKFETYVHEIYKKTN